MTRAQSDSGAKAVCAREKESGDALRSSRKPLRTGAILLVVATVLAVFVNFMPLISFEAILQPRPLPEFRTLSQYRTLLQQRVRKTEEPAEEAPKVIYFQARPSAEPTPPPPITGFRLTAYGRELGPDGFTTFVGDKPVVLSLEIVPYMSHPPVDWSVSDDTAASLTVSNDKKQCEFSALRDAGRIELTVRCSEAEIVMPVYVWGAQKNEG